MYIDSYIIENLLINYIIISCTSILTKNINSKIKKLMGSTIGTIYSVAYIFPSCEFLFTPISKFIFFATRGSEMGLLDLGGAIHMIFTVPRYGICSCAFLERGKIYRKDFSFKTKFNGIFNGESKT